MRVLVWVALLAGCAPRAPFYEPVGFWDADADRVHADLLPWIVDDHLLRGRISSIAVAGSEEPHPLGPEEVRELPEEVLYAAHATSTRRSRGGEFDLLIHRGGRSVPVTVWSSRSGDLVVATGPSPPRPRPAPAHGDAERWKEELADIFGLNAVEDGTRSWSLVELGDLATALDHLSDAERTALRGLTLGRQESSARVPRRELAFYEPRVDPPRIDFFDVAFEAFDSGFVGPVDRPLRAPVMTLLHEFAHALADLPLRRAWERYLEADDAWFAAANDPDTPVDTLRRLERGRRAALRESRRMGLQGPVIEGFRAARGRQRGPTSWAWRRVHESFAEAFALYHADPEALMRVMPDVHAWFDDGGHVAWMRRDGPPATADGASEPPAE